MMFRPEVPKTSRKAVLEEMGRLVIESPPVRRAGGPSRYCSDPEGRDILATPEEVAAARCGDCKKLTILAARRAIDAGAKRVELCMTVTDEPDEHVFMIVDGEFRDPARDAGMPCRIIDWYIPVTIWPLSEFGQSRSASPDGVPLQTSQPTEETSMFQSEADIFEAYGAEFRAQGPLPTKKGIPGSGGAVQYTFSDGSVAYYDKNGNRTRTSGGLSDTSSAQTVGDMDRAVSTSGASAGFVPNVTTRNDGREIWNGQAWVTNTGRQGGRRGVVGKTVTQTVVFSDGSFRTYYSDGSYTKGYKGQAYPPGPVTQDVSTRPMGSRFSLLVVGTDAFRYDNVTQQRVPLGQYMPDGTVLVGNIIYNARNDGTLEWVGPPAVGKVPQADANLIAMQSAATAAAQQTAALAAKAESAETVHLARARAMVPAAPGLPIPMLKAGTFPSARPQPVGTTPVYVIAAGGQPQQPSGISPADLDAVAQGAAEAMAAQLAFGDDFSFDAAGLPVPSGYMGTDAGGGDVYGDGGYDPTGGALGDYHDPRDD